jgi:hypothetical protein
VKNRTDLFSRKIGLSYFPPPVRPERRRAAPKSKGLAVLDALALSACATLPPEIPEAADCRANFLGLDSRVDAADARNAGAYAVPGFPYLRSDRFLASFRDAPDGAPFDAWVERMRQLDLASRASELRNLGWDDPREELGHLDTCGRDWAARDLADLKRRAQLRESVAVPDDYSILRRAFGLYPLAVPFLNMGIRGFNEEIADDYAKPLAELKSPGPLVFWGQGNPGRLAPAQRKFPVDALGVPVISDTQLQELAQAFAPMWLVETSGDYDRIGAPVLKDGTPTVDVERPVTYFAPAYTRFGSDVLVQLVYTAWFSERPESAGYSYAGELDGIVWRVTIDTDGEPLMYDTVHACGCYHYYFLAKPLARKAVGGFWQEPVLFPQEAPGTLFAIRLQARTHYVRRLVPPLEVAKSAADVGEYLLVPYDELLSLPDGKGGRRSLFGEDGIADGTERFERFWLWPAGIKSAGAMRQSGRHATSFVGRSHFDDPYMLERLLMRP